MEQRMDIGQRLVALDGLRGLVMILMVVDHAGGVFDSGHLARDSAALHVVGSALPWDHFLSRWITHLCAPTFVFLAGTALALSIEKRQRQGEAASSLDRHILLRGGLIALCDPTLMSWVLWIQGGRIVLLVVLYAIGLGLICMIPLRRLASRWLLLGAGLWLVAGEALTLTLWDGRSFDAPWPVAALLGIGYYEPVLILYPLVPWLVILILGWVFGRALAEGRLDGRSAERLLWVVGAGFLTLFALVRGYNGYGNFLLLREDGSWAQWLHVSKYPPSLSFVTMTLGVGALFLAFFLRRWRDEEPSPRHPLLVFGQTPFFFYLLHFPLLMIFGVVSGQMNQAGLGATYLATLLTLLLLYPACAAYRTYKRAHPDGWTRYI